MSHLNVAEAGVGVILLVGDVVGFVGYNRHKT